MVGHSLLNGPMLKLRLTGMKYCGQRRTQKLLRRSRKTMAKPAMKSRLRKVGASRPSVVGRREEANWTMG